MFKARNKSAKAVYASAPPLDECIYHCDVCWLGIDRDLNATINLARLAGGRDASY